MLTLEAPAKINWFLLVKGKRPDGYHEIESLLQRLSLHDTLAFEESDSIEVLTEADIPGEENLVHRAAVLLRQKAAAGKGARVVLEKRIPISAGLAGGSSDAAAALMGLNELWGLGLSRGELSGFAASLGSDVPFFLNGPAALVQGRGERVRPMALKRSFAVLLAKPSAGVSAAWAYARADAPGRAGFHPERFVKALQSGDMGALAPMARNDLEGPVLREHPEVGRLKAEMARAGALYTLMSGSGPCVFGVFDAREAAEGAKEAMGEDCWSAVTETVTHGGPPSGM
jgi:4-diphosphocytidyl-2-C-methyl-D-erythritol kinase